MGWLLILEYAISASLVAVGWAGYVVTLLSDFGITFPHVRISGELQPRWATPLILLQSVDTGGYALRFTSTFNLVAVSLRFAWVTRGVYGPVRGRCDRADRCSPFP
jgi:APA family basic amino acid/polyamine antiporter